MKPLADQFEDRVRAGIRDAIAHGGQPTRITQMVDNHGAVGAAKRLVVSGEIQKGMREAVAEGRRSMTVESIMLEAQFADLFSVEELAAARWRLSQV